VEDLSQIAIDVYYSNGGHNAGRIVAGQMEVHRRGMKLPKKGLGKRPVKRKEDQLGGGRIIKAPLGGGIRVRQ
jgi:hypothetical protein